MSFRIFKGKKLPVEVGTTPNGVVRKVFGILLVAEILERVRPEQVAHGAEGGGLFEPIQLVKEEIKVTTIPHSYVR